MPENDADGAEGHGYVKSSTEGFMGYYRDLMQGKVWESTLSKYTGINEAAWRKGTPNKPLSSGSRRLYVPALSPWSYILLTGILTASALLFMRKWKRSA
jgi:hypothetical protein